MSERRPGTGRPRPDEGGFALVELLVVVLVMAVVMTIATSAVITTMQNQRRQMERLEAMNELKIALHRVTRDLRGADPLDATLGDDEVSMTVERAGMERSVTFRLDGDVLVMDETNATGSFTHTLVTGVDASAPLFVYEDGDGAVLATPADPDDVAVVEVRLVRVLPEEGDIELSDRITVRNAGG